MGGQHLRVFFFAYDLPLGAGVLLGLPPDQGIQNRDYLVLTSKRVLFRGRTMSAHKAFHHTKYNDNSAAVSSVTGAFVARVLSMLGAGYRLIGRQLWPPCTTRGLNLTPIVGWSNLSFWKLIFYLCSGKEF